MERSGSTRLIQWRMTLPILLLLSAAAWPDQAEPAKKKNNQLAKIAGSLLQVAAMNYSGPHQQLAQSLVTLFNGGDLSQQQIRYNADDPYGVYANDVYAYDNAQNVPSATQSEYQNAGYYPAGTPSLDAALIGIDADGSLTMLENGSTLQGPRASSPGDRVGIAFMPANDAYIYVVSFDDTGWMQSLYPDPVLGHRNPVPAGEEMLLPGETLYGLDDVPGVETIYILASNHPRPDVEAQLQPFFGKERPAGVSPVYRSVQNPIIISRGLTGLRPASANASQQVSTGSTSTTPTTATAPVLNSFLAADGADELAITLWFNHE